METNLKWTAKTNPGDKPIWSIYKKKINMILFPFLNVSRVILLFFPACCCYISSGLHGDDKLILNIILLCLTQDSFTSFNMETCMSTSIFLFLSFPFYVAYERIR